MTTTTFTVDAKEFAYTLRRVAGFTSRDPKVHFLHWIRVFTRGGYVYVAATDRYLFRADSDEIGLVMPARFTVYESDVFAGWEWLQEGDE